MTNKSKRDFPTLVYANEEGEIFDYPGLHMAGRLGNTFVRPDISELIPLPEGSELFVLPDTVPVAWDPFQEDFVYFDTEFQGKRALAVAAFMAPAYTQIYLCAFKKKDRAQILPLFAYTAVGWWKGRFWVCGFRSDPDKRQDIKGFNQREVVKRTKALLRRYKGNRLFQHLGKCSLTYGCPAAKNLFLGRFEAPLPTSKACNARCLGCLSLQEEGGPPATQERITFVPSPREVKEVALYHLERVKKGVVSFGQGCEGEPLLQSELISSAIKGIRKVTKRGTINLNSNSSLPQKLKVLIESGLDSIRISLNSLLPEYYERYYRPKGYNLKDVLFSWRLAKEAGLHVSLNLFIMPGVTDQEDHVEILSNLIERFGLDLIQLRNHNIDPDWYLEKIGFKDTGKALGVKGMVELLKKRFPQLKFGYFNPPLKD